MSSWRFRGGSTIAALGAIAVVLACSPEDSEPAGDRYQVRGVVRAAQLADEPRRLRIQHESIEDLIGVDGLVEPMNAMTMSMVVAESTNVPDGLVQGDKVRFVLDVDWSRSPTALIVEVERLDGSAELQLE